MIKEKDLQAIQRTKKSKDSGIRSKLRKIVWAVAGVAFILILTLGRDVSAYFAAAIIAIIAVEFHIMAKYIDLSMMTWDLAISLACGYFLGFAAFILVPIDTAEAVRDENLFRQSKAQATSTTYNETYVKWWKVIYWTMMGLNMFFMNLQNLYHKTGHLYFLSRIKATFIAYGKLLIVFAVPYVIGCIVIFIFTKSVEVNVMTQVFLLLSNVYGITVLVLLIGYGLVQFPYSLWRKTYCNRTLDLYLTQADALYNRYLETITLQQVATVRMRTLIDKIYDGHELGKFKSQLIDELPNLDEYQAVRTSSNSSLKQFADLPPIITEEVVAQVRFQLKAATYNFIKVFNKWKQHCDHIYVIVELESLEMKKAPQVQKQPEDNKKDKKKNQKDKNKLVSTFLTSSSSETSSLEYKQLKSKHMGTLKTIIYRIAAILFGLISVLLLFCETALIFSTENNDAILFYKIIKGSTNVGGITSLIILVLGYIIFCSIFALFEIDLGAGFEIYPYHTHPLTMMFNSKTCGTIAIPLIYNVMLIFQQVNNSTLHVKSGFDTFYQPLTSVPFFGSMYNLIVCLLIAVVGILSLFSSVKNIVSKVTRNKIGLAGGDIIQEKIKDGEKCVLWEWERRKRAQQIKKLSRRDNDEEDSLQNQDAISSCWQRFKETFQRKQVQAPVEQKKSIELRTNSGISFQQQSRSVEENEIIARIKYQQQILNELSLEEMVNNKGQTKGTELNMDDSFFSSDKNEKAGAAEGKINPASEKPSFQRASLSPTRPNDEERRSTLSQRTATTELYNKMNKKVNAPLKTLDSIVLETQESAESSDKKLVNQTSKNEQDLHHFEVNINGNSVAYPQGNSKGDKKKQPAQNGREEMNKDENLTETESALSYTNSVQDQGIALNSYQNQDKLGEKLNKKQAGGYEEERYSKQQQQAPRELTNKQFNLKEKVLESASKQFHDFGGWVLKKSENQMMRKLQGWKKKYLVLHEQDLAYFDDEEKKHNGHVIKFKDIKEIKLYLSDPKKAKKETKDGDLRFLVHCNERKYDFKANTPQEAISWVNKIKDALRGQDGI